MKLKFLTSLFILTISASCSYRTDFTLISTKNVDISNGAEFRRGRDRVVGEDAKYVFFIFPTGIPTVQRAVERAIESSPGSVALVDAKVIYKWWYIPYIFGRQCYRVEGTPLVDTVMYRRKY